jgi:hypothetical protein
MFFEVFTLKLRKTQIKVIQTQNVQSFQNYLLFHNLIIFYNY